MDALFFEQQGNAPTIKSFLNLLAKNSELITEVFNSGSVEEDLSNTVEISKLKQKRIIFSTERGTLRLNPKVQHLLSHALETETSRYFDSGFARRIPELQDLCDRYVVSLSRGDAEITKRALLDVETVVYEIIMESEDSCRRLRKRVFNKFGYVNSLSAKKTENENALNQANELVDNLGKFTYSTLVEVAQHNETLESLLCCELIKNIAKSQTELNTIITQLRQLMTTYRKQEHRKDLVRSFSEHMLQSPGWEPKCPVDNQDSSHILTSVVNVAAKLEIHCQPDIDDMRQDDELSAIVSKLNFSGEQQPDKKKDRTSEAFDLKVKDEQVEVQKEVFEELFENLLIKSLSSKEPISAEKYWQEEAIPFALDIWLFGVVTSFGELSNKRSKHFSMVLEGISSYCDYGDKLLSDVKINFNK